MADLLRQHGALDDLPRADQIIVSRPAANFSDIVFLKSSEDWNPYTLFDLLVIRYGLPSYMEASPGMLRSQAAKNPLGYPDFSRVRLRRFASDRKSWEDRTLDLTAALQSGDCSANVPLQWGDVIEIPEMDHVLNENWSGLSSQEQATLIKCLSRHVEVILHGRTNNLSLSAGSDPAKPEAFAMVPEFQLDPVLRKSNLLLASSDLSRVKVTRRDAATGQEKEWIVDCANSNKRANFWLLDGDRIEVPERTAAAAK